jgi:hypothetical protein
MMPLTGVRKRALTMPRTGRPLIRRRLSGHIAKTGRVAMEGKARFIFPILATAVIVFVVSAVVTFVNIGFRADFVRRWLSAFIVGWPVASVAAYVALPFVSRATMRIVDLIEGRGV